MSEPMLTHKKLLWASVYSLGWFSLPLVVYANKNFFNRFCSFHSRILRLDKKGPAGIASLALIMSIFYSGICVPIYYRGLLRILDIKELEDLRGCITDNLLQNEKINDGLKEMDSRLVKQIDESIGVPQEKTADFIKSVYRET